MRHGYRLKGNSSRDRINDSFSVEIPQGKIARRVNAVLTLAADYSAREQFPESAPISIFHRRTRFTILGPACEVTALGTPAELSCLVRASQ